MLKRVLFIILFLASIPFVQAQFDVSIPDSVLAVNGNAVIPITITNNQNFNDKYTINGLDFNWLIESVSDSNVAQGEIKVINLKLKSSLEIEPKSYGIKLNIKSLSGKSIEQIAKIVVPEENSAFGIKILGPDALDPRKEMNKLTLEFENYYGTDFDFNIFLMSSAFSENKQILLEKNSKKEVEFNIKLPEDTPEGDHITSVLFYKDNELAANQTVTLKISQYSGIREIVTEEESILVKTESIKKINDGNAIGFQKYTRTLTFFEKLFTSTDPIPDTIIKKEDSYLLTWDIRLEPGQEKTIEVKTNYRNPAIALVVLIVLLVIVYLRLKREIKITKKALLLKTEKGVSKIKVVITLHNKGKTTYNIKLMERIPNAASDPSEFATLKPSHIARGTTATNLVWKIPEIKANGELVISYVVGIKAHKVGKIILPQALARYISGKNTLEASSSRVRISK